MLDAKMLESKNVQELCAMCKSNGITYYSHGKKLKKKEIIDKLVAYYFNEYEKQDVQKKISETGDVEIDHDGKKRYVDSIKVGMLVAFREPETGKLNTALVKNKSYENKKLKLVTSYKKEFIVDYSDIVWVKTGKRWPKGIYNELKGIN